MKPIHITCQMLVQTTCGYLTTIEFVYILLRHKAINAPFPWAHLIWTIYSLWRGGRGGEDCRPLRRLPVQAFRILFLIVCYWYARLCSTRRQSSMLLNNTAALKKSRIWPNLAQTGHWDQNRVLLWWVDFCDSSLTITGQILYAKKYCPKSSHYWGLYLSLHSL